MSYHGYNRIMLKQLHYYYKTSHVLVVQADGFVLHPWLQFDCIGAPLPQRIRMGEYAVELTNRVGNGAFPFAA